MWDIYHIFRIIGVAAHINVQNLADNAQNYAITYRVFLEIAAKQSVVTDYWL